MRKVLRSSEWVLVGSFLILFTSLVLVSRFHEYRVVSQLKFYADKVEKPVTVTISGAVLNPGSFVVSPDTLLRDVVKKSRPKRLADLKFLALECPVGRDLIIDVAELSEIHVYVSGAVVEPIELLVPVGTRLCDLKSKIQLNKGADQNFMKRIRVLKDGERVVIPEAGKILKREVE